MADKLTSIKIKQKNGSYTTQIPISVSAQNVQWDGSHSLLDILGSVDINVGGKGNVQHQFNDLYQNIDAFTDDINSEMTDFTNSTNQNITNFTNSTNQSIADFTNATNQHLSDVLGNISTETKGTVQAQMDKLQNDMNTFHTQMAAEIGTNVSDWLQQNVTPAGSMTMVDNSLTISDAAADAKAVGDALTSLNGSLGTLKADLDDNVNDLKSTIKEYGTYPLNNDFFTKTSGTHNGVTYTWGADGTCTVTGGTTTNPSVNNLYNNPTALPNGIETNHTYYIKYKTTNEDVRLSFAIYKSDSSIEYYNYTADGSITLPTNTVGLIIRLYVLAGIMLTNPVAVTVVDILDRTSTYQKIIKLENDTISLNGSLGDVKADLKEYNSFDYLQNATRTNKTHNGVTYTWTGKTCKLVGTSTGDSYNVLVAQSNVFLGDFVGLAGKTIIAYYSGEKSSLNVRFYKNNDVIFDQYVKNGAQMIDVPSDAEGIVIRLFLPTGNSIDETVNMYVCSSGTIDIVEGSLHPIKYTDGIATGTNLNDLAVQTVCIDPGGNTINSPQPGQAGYVFTFGTSAQSRIQYWIGYITGKVFYRRYLKGTWYSWIPNGNALYFNTDASADLNDQPIQTVAVDGGHNTAHSPISGGAAYVFTFGTTSFSRIQYWVGYITGRTFYRRYLSGTWYDWIEMKNGDTYENTYTTEYYENTYNIECTPTITSDTNNYIASTGDTTDRTGDIQTMLNTTGVCRLGPGVFYVTGVEIPNFGSLIGSGKKTQIILASSVTNGYAVKLRTYSTVKDVLILGSVDAITPSSTVGNRHGIVFEGTANAQSSPQSFYRSYITGCLIRDFAGGGITCRNTGLSPAASLVVSDCQIARCDVGVNVSYFSEFHRWTNVTAQECYYGCICNGGNNNFVNCDFSMNKIALLIDNSTGQSRNNTHGTFSACSFHHSDNTYSGGTIVSAGTAIRILGAIGGEIFSGCQIGYGKLEIDDSLGIRFAACNFLRMTALEITDSPLVVFSDCNFWDATSSPLSQSGNTTLKFHDCYLLTSGAAFDPMTS